MTQLDKSTIDAKNLVKQKLKKQN